MSVALKIRYLSMAGEVRVIRQEIKMRGRRMGRIRIATSKDDPALRWKEDATLALTGLCEHLHFAVRPEVRSTHLARMFLKGTPLIEVEKRCYEEPEWDRIERLIFKFGPKIDPRITAQNFAEWKSGMNLQKRDNAPRPKPTEKTIAERTAKRSIYYEIEETLKGKGMDDASRHDWWRSQYNTQVNDKITRKQAFAKGYGNILLAELRKAA